MGTVIQLLTTEKVTVEEDQLTVQKKIQEGQFSTFRKRN